ncbi:hypothetical protein K488DRAFT_83223 [Vararia minispora EC-137]|uniref:Uncharacterized protein n=1 Tax=Vararia minispora EC-137 TaxID=1314806 RepID=A0ACB8QTS8_9AGAM|nr:hypothetical protein K488DRAFT_83223 [Vararia minispora EC-137]
MSSVPSSNTVTPNFPFGTVEKSERGLPEDWDGEAIPIRSLSSPKEPFNDDELLAIKLPGTLTSDDEHGSAACMLGGRALRRILATPGFPQSPPQPSRSVFELREVAGAGLGLFATVDIALGELILCERPLLFSPSWSAFVTFPPEYPLEKIARVTRHEWEKYLAKVLSHIPETRRAKYLALTNSHLHDGSGPLFGIKRTNCWSSGLEETIHPREGVSEQAPYVMVGDLSSRVNHSCCPNSRVLIHEPSFSLGLRALRTIRAGEEITVSYCDILAPCETRQRALARYGFRCTCAACSDPGKSDHIRAYWSKKGAFDWSDATFNSAGALRVISLLDGAGLQSIPQYRSFHAMAGTVFAKEGKMQKANKYLGRWTVLRQVQPGMGWAE